MPSYFNSRLLGVFLHDFQTYLCGICAGVCVCVRACIHACVCVCMYVCVCTPEN